MICAPVQYCRHWDVEWEDSHNCHCQACGKHGQWFEEGYVLWKKQGPGTAASKPRPTAIALLTRTIQPNPGRTTAEPTGSAARRTA